VSRWFDKELVEAVFEAHEWAFDAGRLAPRMTAELERCGVRVFCDAEVERVVQASESRPGLVIEARRQESGERLQLGARFAFNCTYSSMNELLSRSGLPRIPLKLELAEIALVEVPPELRKVGVTLMCGPFFSFMPFPARGLHSFSHVRYTPHRAWSDAEAGGARPLDQAAQKSRFPWMQIDARRYMPVVDKFVHRESLFELKAVLPQSELDDSRPILFRTDPDLRGLVSVLGGKIDNVYDVERELDFLQKSEGA
jgi:hypothetical protein